MSRKDKCTQKNKVPQNNLDHIKVNIDGKFYNINFPEVGAEITENYENLDKISIHDFMKIINKNNVPNQSWLQNRQKISSEDPDAFNKDFYNRRINNYKNISEANYENSINIEFSEEVLANILLSIWIEDSINFIGPW